MAEQQVEFIRDLTKAYEQKSIPTLSNLLHPDYVHITRPQSVNIPKQNKAQYLEYFEKMFNNWAEVGTPSLIVVANSVGKLLLTDVTLKSGSVVTYEAFTDYHIVEDQSGNKKISYAEEFIDANAHANGFAPFVAAKA